MGRKCWQTKKLSHAHMRRSVKWFKEAVLENKKICAITTYTANIAHITDNIADIILVGDSLGMVLYGYPSTTFTTLGMMIEHGKAVSKTCKKAFVVVDMPFATYESSPQQAFENAAKIIHTTGCDAIKLEGGVEMAETIQFLTSRGIVVMGHVGLMPQRVNALGSYKKVLDSKKVIEDAEAVSNAGVFSLVLENIDEVTAEQITKTIEQPTISIGSGKMCNGEIAVLEDICGLSTFQPAFVTKEANLLAEIATAIQKYKNKI